MQKYQAWPCMTMPKPCHQFKDQVPTSGSVAQSVPTQARSCATSHPFLLFCPERQARPVPAQARPCQVPGCYVCYFSDLKAHGLLAI